MSKDKGNNGNRGGGKANNQAARASNSSQGGRSTDRENIPRPTTVNASTDSQSLGRLTTTFDTMEANASTVDPSFGSSNNGTNPTVEGSSIHSNPSQPIVSHRERNVPPTESPRQAAPTQGQPQSSQTVGPSCQVSNPITGSGAGSSSEASSVPTNSAATNNNDTSSTTAAHTPAGGTDASNQHFGALTNSAGTPQS